MVGARMQKQHIVDEIKRTAKSNGGAPLGKDRFFQETGIKDSDWFGKYWSRWGDAVKAAGFTPNKLQGAYPEEEIIEKFIGLIRELGRLPVTGELRLKRRNDPSFPNDKVFYSRFGSKSGILSKILSYCRARTGFDDVIEICLAGSGKESKSKTDEGSETAEIGYVYLLKCGRHYKIGRTNAVGRREYELAIQLPEKALTIHVIRTDDPSGIEAYWHNRFAAKRANGEWFALDTTDVNAFRRRRFQ